jgi:squalene-associated FAD-dependent desaturase
MRAAVVGAGYAGLAAAVELAARGVSVDVFEASRTLGGRARAVTLEGLTVDNGAHILLGAYRETLRLMQLVGVSDKALQRRCLRLDYPGHLRIAAPPLPAPLHLAWALAAASGLPMAAKLAALRFMNRLKAQSFRLPTDTTVSALLANQPARLRRYLWEPLCLAALNTPPETASAQVFLNVLRDSLAAERAASDLLLPTTDFSSLFPDPAARFVEARGGRIRRSCRVGEITSINGRFQVEAHGLYDRLVLAVAPQHLPPLLAGLPGIGGITEQVGRLDYQPIVTCYLAYPIGVRLPFPMVGADGGLAQWFFDRGQLSGQPGLIAAVISAHGPHEDLDQESLVARIHAELAATMPGTPAPRWGRVIAERRATFTCRPGMDRPTARTPLPGLVLAGDYVDGDYPATIEAAVRSGVAAAHLLRDQTPPR